MNSLYKTNYLFIAIILLCTGCWRSEEELQDTTTQLVSAAEFSCRFSLRQIPPSSNGAYGFRSQSNILLLYPGLTTATYKGQIINLPAAPTIGAAGLLIPLETINSLPTEILDREKIKKRLTTVIIDPGHGGHDPGANNGSLNEKDLTLQIAKEVANILSHSGIPVKLTRSNDTFLSLRERCAIANTNPGAIFVSIHANSSSSLNATGVETYYISPKITDEHRAEMAVSRYVLGGPNGRYSRKHGYNTALDLSERYREESKRLANSIQMSLSQYTKDKNRGVKSANYAVLRESFFGPGVLTEIGFVSNPTTKNLLQTQSYKSKIATAIAMAINNYLSSCPK